MAEAYSLNDELIESGHATGVSSVMTMMLCCSALAMLGHSAVVEAGTLKITLQPSLMSAFICVI